MHYYLVGGAVRDLLLGRPPRDLDYVFTGDVASFLAEHSDAHTVGKSHELFILHGHEYAPLQGATIDEDLAQRDFTLNALALGEDGMLHMHPKALSDLSNGLLRPVADDIFLRDPIRIFRLARFLAEWPKSQITAEMQDVLASFPKDLLFGISAERVGNELRKALRAAEPERFFRLLDHYALLSPWFEELAFAQAIPAGPLPWHAESVFEHTMAVMHAVEGDEMAVWMALCHDLGKCTTDREILPHHYGHEKRGVDAGQALAKRLALPSIFGRAAALICREHMKAGKLSSLRYGTRCDLLLNVNALRLNEPFWRVVNADSHKNLSSEAGRELTVLLSVRLPERFQNQGKRSAEKLRQLRIEALQKVCQRVLDPSL